MHMKRRRVSSQVECQRYDNILGTQNVSISPTIQVFLSKMALFVLTHDTSVLTSSYVTLTDEEYLRMTAEHRRGMNKCVYLYL